MTTAQHVVQVGASKKRKKVNHSNLYKYGPGLPLAVIARLKPEYIREKLKRLQDIIKIFFSILNFLKLLTR